MKRAKNTFTSQPSNPPTHPSSFSFIPPPTPPHPMIYPASVHSHPHLSFCPFIGFLFLFSHPLIHPPILSSFYLLTHLAFLPFTFPSLRPPIFHHRRPDCTGREGKKLKKKKKCITESKLKAQCEHLFNQHLSSQFRENVQDVLPALPNPDDYFLLRWLRGEGGCGGGQGKGQQEGPGTKCSRRTHGSQDPITSSCFTFRSQRGEGTGKEAPSKAPVPSIALPPAQGQDKMTARQPLSHLTPSFRLPTARNFDLQKSEAMLRKVRPVPL